MVYYYLDPGVSVSVMVPWLLPALVTVMVRDLDCRMCDRAERLVR